MMRLFRHRDQGFEDLMASIERRKAMGIAIGEMRIAKTVMPDAPKPENQSQEAGTYPDEASTSSSTEPDYLQSSNPTPLS